jgi:hypothetical protein
MHALPLYTSRHSLNWQAAPKRPVMFWLTGAAVSLVGAEGSSTGLQAAVGVSAGRMVKWGEGDGQAAGKRGGKRGRGRQPQMKRT